MKGSIARLPKAPRISEEETHILLRAAQAGDSAARNKLVTQNLRLVMKVVNRVAGKSSHAVAIDDLFQCGIVGAGPHAGGLMRAIETYDFSGRTKFSTWAVQYINGAVLEAISGGLVASRNLRIYTAAAERKRDELASELGRSATDAEIVDSFEAKSTRRRVKAALKNPTPNHLSIDALDEKAHQLDDKHLRNRVVQITNDPSVVTEDEILEAIDVDALCGKAAQAALKRLTARERAVLQRRFGFVTGQEETLVEVGLALGISRPHVLQIQNAALGKLRKALTSGSAC